jgi:endonuclease III
LVVGSETIVERLLEQHGQMFTDELGLDLSRSAPSPLYRLLTGAMLCSAQVDHRTALAAAERFAERGWTTARAMADTTWAQRVSALREAGYTRYDERTARMLGTCAEQLLSGYAGDLRRLRAAAGEDAAQTRRLLKQLEGVGDVAVDIVFRELQAVWPELYPFADRRAMDVAKRLRLAATAEELAGVTGRDRFPRVVAALIRADRLRASRAA